MSENVCLDDIFWITEHFVTKFGIVMQHHEPECLVDFCFCFCYLQGQCHNKSSYGQNTTVSTIFSELLIPWQPNLIWWYIIVSQSVLWKKNLDYCIQGQGHSKGSKCYSLSRWYPLNHQTFCFQTWYCNAPLWVRVSCKKIWFAIFKVKVTVGAHMIKIWQFLLYLLNCWSVCYQTWFDSTLS